MTKFTKSREFFAAYSSAKPELPGQETLLLENSCSRGAFTRRTLNIRGAIPCPRNGREGLVPDFSNKVSGVPRDWESSTRSLGLSNSSNACWLVKFESTPEATFRQIPNRANSQLAERGMGPQGLSSPFGSKEYL